MINPVLAHRSSQDVQAKEKSKPKNNPYKSQQQPASVDRILLVFHGIGWCLVCSETSPWSRAGAGNTVPAARARKRVNSGDEL